MSTQDNIDAKVAHAALTHDTEELGKLLRSGANPDATLQGFGTLLLYAVRQGNIHTVQMVVEAGAAVNLPASDGETPLMRAASQGTPEIAAYLLEQGADPLARDGYGRTAQDRTRSAVDRLGRESDELGMTVEDVQVQCQRLGRAALLLIEAEKRQHELNQISACHAGTPAAITVNRPLQLKPWGKP